MLRRGLDALHLRSPIQSDRGGSESKHLFVLCVEQVVDPSPQRQSAGDVVTRRQIYECVRLQTNSLVRPDIVIDIFPTPDETCLNMGA